MWRIAALLVVVGLIPFTPAAGAEPGILADHPVNTWVKQSPRKGKPSPKFGWEGSAAYDPYERLWIHHAGHDGIPQGFVTFTFDLATGAWWQRFPPTSPPGVCCVDGANVFDAANRVFVRFPGGSLGHGYQWSRGVKLKESPVWLYDASANRWTNMRPPPYVDVSRTKDAIGGLNPCGAYDGVHQLAISFGGQGSAGGKSNLHAYDAWSNTLYQLKPANKSDAWPSERDGAALAFDGAHEKLVLFGGQYTNDERTWIYDFKTNRWEARDLSPHPPARKDAKTYSTIPKMTYDPIHRVLICIIWIDEQGGHETWILDLEKMAWTKADPAAEPAHSKSRTRNLDFSVADNVAILETWSLDGQPQVWTYRYLPAPVSGSLGRPENLKIVTTETGVALTWSAVGGAEEYRIYRGAAGRPWEVESAPIARVKNPAYDDTGLKSGAVCTYIVRAEAGGMEGPPSSRVRTDPRVAVRPIVSVLDKDHVRISWQQQPSSDIAGYNVYRGVVAPRTVLKGTQAAWRDNDPQYAAAVVTGVSQISEPVKLNGKPIDGTTFDDAADLTANPAADYRWAVYAYVVRAVNRLGVESGPSPYALTIPSEPVNVFCREAGERAELKWDANPESAIAGYHVYKLQGGVFGIARITESPLKETNFTHAAGKETTRYWITAIDALGQEGQPSSPVWYRKSYKGFYDGDWHQ